MEKPQPVTEVGRVLHVLKFQEVHHAPGAQLDLAAFRRRDQDSSKGRIVAVLSG
eukprot:CAMPEP_0170609478 /NCGR_PEP_ID=MMETSP0224-20130122/22150_1 /TAXON_ID=285029 /ORGANISM="Togula jolla, Strain CCCM 725" /LENGTH=53 /DNA_ID=CAMNT_0010934795 /DNA_START=168 /DNA_END=329 /DNA_ORIENTATION=-